MACTRNTLQVIQGRIAQRLGSPYLQAQNFNRLSPDVRDEIVELARDGFTYLQQLFGNDIQDFSDFLDGCAPGCCIDVRGLHVPWPLLYPEQTLRRDDAQVDRFLGYRNVFVDVLHQTKRPRASMGGLAILSGVLGRARVGIAEDDLLASYNTGEPTAIQSELHGPFLSLPQLSTTDPNSMATYANFWTGPRRLMHYSCHSTLPDLDAFRFELRLSTNFLHTGRDIINIWTQRPIARHLKVPLVFFNSCSSGTGDSEQHSSISLVASEKRASLAVGTLGTIRDDVAVDVGSRFYRAARSGPRGRELVYCLHQAQREVIDGTGHPCTLAYQAFGSSALAAQEIAPR